MISRLAGSITEERPFKKTFENGLPVSYHSKFFNASEMSRRYAVKVRGNTNYEVPDTPSDHISRGGDQGNYTRTIDAHPRYQDTLIVHAGYGSNPVETTFANKAYQADPFGFEQEGHSSQKEFFANRNQAVQTVFNGPDVRAREELIQNAREASCIMMNAINRVRNTALRNGVIDTGIHSAGAATLGPGIVGGVTHAAAAGGAAAAVSSSVMLAPVYVGVAGAKMIHDRHLSGTTIRKAKVTAKLDPLQNNMGRVLTDAKYIRDANIEINPALSVRDTRNFVKAWDEVDRLLPRYVSKLSALREESSTTVPHNYAVSDVTIVGTELKLLLIAEHHHLNNLT